MDTAFTPEYSFNSLTTVKTTVTTAVSAEVMTV